MDYGRKVDENTKEEGKLFLKEMPYLQKNFRMNFSGFL